MKEKNAIKISLGMAISMIIVLIILLMGGFLLYKNHVKITQLEDKIAKQKINDEKNIVKNSTVNNTSVKSNEVIESENSETVQLVIPSLFTSNAKK